MRNAGVGTAPGGGPLGLPPWLVVAAYTVVLTGLCLFRFQHWFATGWDLGFYQQGLWAIWHHGLWARSSFIDEPVLADTASFVLWPLAPLYHYLGTDFLLLLQTFSLGLGYWWIQQIGNDLGVSRVMATVVGVLYLLFPALLAANLYDFHPDVLAVPLLLAAIHYAMKEKWVAYVIVVVLALAMKDMVAVAVIGLGLSLILGRDRGPKVWGLVTVAVGVGWLFGTTAYLIPLLSGHAMNQWSAYYGQYGSTPIQGAETILGHPWLIFGWAVETRPWEYLIWIFGPMLGILGLGRRSFDRDWRWLAGALLVLEINCLSRFASQTSPFDQYSLFALPSLFVTALVVVKSVPWDWAAWRTRGAVGISLLFLLVMAWHLHDTTWRGWPSNRPELVQATAMIPKAVPVVAQNFVLPHVSNRGKAIDANTLGSKKLVIGTYVVLDPEFSTGNTPKALVRSWTTLLSQKARLVYGKDDVYLFKIVHSLS